MTTFKVRLIFDCSVLAALLAIIFYFNNFAKPFRRGFFCNDQSLNHPYLESSVPSWLLYTMGVFIPLGIVTVTEWFRMLRHERRLKNLAKKLYVHYAVWYGFGAMVTQALTTMIKFYVSRLRPHFFAACRPDWTPIAKLCSENLYVVDYNCTNAHISPTHKRESFVSFPSAHSSFGFYASVFIALYLYERWDCKHRSVIIRPFVQLFFITCSTVVGISRINDFKHHPTDVMAGAMLGTAIALFFYFAIDIRHLSEEYFGDVPEEITIAGDSEFGYFNNRPLSTIREAKTYQTFFSVPDGIARMERRYPL